MHLISKLLQHRHLETVTFCSLDRFGIARVGVPDSEANSTGAKGIGEPPLIPTAPAIANAVYDAIGVRISELPITP